MTLVFFLPRFLVWTSVVKVGSVENCTSMPLICLSSALVFLVFLIFFQETVTLPFFAALALTLAGALEMVIAGSAGVAGEPHPT